MGARRSHALPLVDHLGPPLPRPVQDRERNSATPERPHHQPTAGVRGVGAVVAGPAEGHELVEVEVRAALGALEDVTDSKRAA